MHKDKNINIAIVGLGFGAEFIPIYQNHPYAKMVKRNACPTSGKRLEREQNNVL